ncbi:NADP-dependent oxidoreductase [Mucilaginibacter sp.]
MNKVLHLKSRPNGLPKATDFEIIEQQIPVNNLGELLLKSIYISVDPYLRGKMSKTYSPPFELNEPVASKVVARVIDSKNESFTAGDYVIGYLNWAEYQLSNGTGLSKIDNHDASLSAYLGVLGTTGLSAYFALLDIGKPKPGDTLVVSGAAGAVGSIAGQIGKISGCRVIGIAGTDEKTELLKSKFGFDDAINYKTTPDINAAIKAVCPNGVDVYFDNVGGEISDAVINNLNNNARIAVCGSISNYNDTETQIGPRLLPLVVYKRLSIRGFLIADYADKFTEGVSQLTAWLKDGKLTYSETVMEGFDQLPEAFIGLFEGRNEGKMIVKV